ncbi:hypothetical protein R5N98_08080 [Tenacibaculum maritimum]|uniref:hypothetical protein n=1 Tax=Tenacibaculum maritimum TaxID=107401 RepID=UPI0012E578E2|nr:hypothetical protein [Tenacibaculum maritimum]CAA0224420.1 conserved membrane hypothetical protein [Tenacibaculum maritimum]CAA0232616.1 conserved membrane hypothetical protein [Tenacibaculum maritimum]
MKLTNNEIKALYKFTQEHYVAYYDVQVELVDHLANDIEKIWEGSPSLSFEKARERAFKKFGVFGFLDIVEEKRKQVGKKYRRILWKFTEEWFKLPKIVWTIMIFLFFYSLTQFKISAYVFSFILFSIGIIDIFLCFKLKRNSNKRFKKQGKKWMLEEMIFNVASFNGIFLSSNIVGIHTKLVEEVPSFNFSILISIIATVAMLYSYISLILIPSKADKLLLEAYPEYGLI